MSESNNSATVRVAETSANYIDICSEHFILDNNNLTRATPVGPHTYKCSTIVNKEWFIKLFKEWVLTDPETMDLLSEFLNEHKHSVMIDAEMTESTLHNDVNRLNKEGGNNNG